MRMCREKACVGENDSRAPLSSSLTNVNGSTEAKRPHIGWVYRKTRYSILLFSIAVNLIEIYAYSAFFELDGPPQTQIIDPAFPVFHRASRYPLIKAGRRNTRILKSNSNCRKLLTFSICLIYCGSVVVNLK